MAFTREALLRRSTPGEKICRVMAVENFSIVNWKYRGGSEKLGKQAAPLIRQVCDVFLTYRYLPSSHGLRIDTLVRVSWETGIVGFRYAG